MNIHQTAREELCADCREIPVHRLTPCSCEDGCEDFQLTVESLLHQLESCPDHLSPHIRAEIERLNKEVL